MGYDINLKINTGNKMVSIADFNFTYNAYDQFRLALTSGYSKPFGFSDLNGLACSEVAEPLAKAVKHMEGNREDYRPLEPDNCWGCYEDTLRFLKDFSETVTAHPLCVIEIA